MSSSSSSSGSAAAAAAAGAASPPAAGAAATAKAEGSARKALTCRQRTRAAQGNSQSSAPGHRFQPASHRSLGKLGGCLLLLPPIPALTRAPAQPRTFSASGKL